MKEKITTTLIATVLILVLSGMIFLAIKYPREYPGYDTQPILGPTYPYPLT